MATIEMDTATHGMLVQHLLGRADDFEEGAFLMARAIVDGHSTRLVAEHLVPVPPQGYSYQGPYYLELTDEFRAGLIRRAWRAGASLVEFHAHPGQATLATFSPSDIRGLREFVPHIWWRLERRPYAAVVVAPESFDALAWDTGPADATTLEALVIDGRRLLPTGRSLTHWESHGTAV